MSKILKIGMITAGILLIGGALLIGGLMIGRFALNGVGFFPGGLKTADQNGYTENYGYGRGMMGRYNGAGNQNNYTSGFGSRTGRGMMNGSYGYTGGGMMRGSYGDTGRGMMGGYGNFGANSTPQNPIGMADAKAAFEKYISSLNNNDLSLSEVMVFSNNAYGLIVEKSTGIGAMELLVDPQTKIVTSEPGPNHMWNIKYGMMSGSGVSGCRMGQAGANSNATADAKMSISPETAIKNAQTFLDSSLPGMMAATDPQAFYGYYTLDYEKDGKPAGMLSVNGFSGQVFLHTWHATFIEESKM